MPLIGEELNNSSYSEKEISNQRAAQSLFTFIIYYLFNSTNDLL